MGLKQLEWHEQTGGGWVARVATRFDYNTEKFVYRRFAQVNIFDWYEVQTAHKNRDKIPVALVPISIGNAVTWHDSIEAAKIYVEAIFALED